MLNWIRARLSIAAAGIAWATTAGAGQPQVTVAGDAEPRFGQLHQ
jgi:hypothetical protein